MFKAYLILLSILLASCQTSTYYLVKDGAWALKAEGTFSILKDTVSNEACYYHVTQLDRHFSGEISPKLFSLPTFNTPGRTNKELSVADLDKLTKSVLKKVNFNIQADTLLFILRGNVLAYCSPDFDQREATNAISLNRDDEWSITDPPIRAVYPDDKTNENSNEIFRILYYYPRQKQYLIKDCFRVKNGYLHFVYIFQSRIKKYSQTNPREWCTMWDVTDPQHIFYTIELFRRANALSVRNRLIHK